MQIQQRLALTEKSPKHYGGNAEHIEDLPAIPDKLYFTIGEASMLSLVKSHVLRYWEKEFAFALVPDKRKGGRRRYERKDLLVIRRIRDLLYSQGFTIGGAKVKLKSEMELNHPPCDNIKLIQRLIPELKKILAVLKH